MTDARYARSRAAVHEAVCTVLVADGISGLTVDRLAAEGGVSRSTIYRNWPDMAALACDVFDELIDRDAVDLRGEPGMALHGYLADYARRLNDPIYTAVLVALIEGSARDESFAQVHRRAFSQTRSRAGALIRRAVEQGVIDAGLDVQQCVEDLVSPFLYRCLVTRTRITSGHVDDLHARLLQRWSPRRR
jgi:AcrR family transcriptional regulator